MKKNLTIVILMVSLINVFSQNIDLKKGLVAYYPFEGNAYDKSGNGNHGIIYGSSFEDGIRGQAIFFKNTNNSGYFDVKDYVKLPTITLKDFTISFWVKWAKANNFDPSAALYSFGDHSTDQYCIIFVNSNTGEGSVAYKNNESTVTGFIFDISDGIWHHILLTKNENYISFYFDGKKKNWGFSNNTPFINVPQYIGLHQWYKGNGRSSRFHGLIDEVRIYNRALNDKEIYALYKNAY